MGAGHQKDQAVIRSLAFSAPDPHAPERGERLEMELITGHVYVRRPPQNPDVMGFGDLPEW